MNPPGAPGLRLVVMGPSGCGKTTLARALARALQLRFIEGDDLHPPANVAKMRAGMPLDDADRAPWLQAVGAALAEPASQGLVVTCSALKRRYRDQLRARAGLLRLVLPRVPRGNLAGRMASREGHYMPASLLESQLADFEPLGRDEPGIEVDGLCHLEEQVREVRSWLAC